MGSISLQFAVCPSGRLCDGTIPMCAAVVARDIQGGTLTISWKDDQALLLTGHSLVPLPPGDSEINLKWMFQPLVSHETLVFQVNVKAGSIMQKGEYSFEV